ncbi:hypothetical protein [Bacillus thuringiensis]|uniref:Uncharacterized protein n=1 Tax=Bacillus thuringiensis serovar andalousiensis TaxID=257985 RepID=A0A6H0TLG8_BACTU|nr:hypothetical protein [Bacillus thuringiensis]QIW21317.1 hypothetical protein EVG22_24085 [Bacillus thuringiensis serovar andalousiensis]
MNIYIKDVSIEYLEVTRMGDKEQRLNPTDAIVSYELIKGNNNLSGRLSTPFDEYKEMKHEDLINKIHENLF